MDIKKIIAGIAGIGALAVVGLLVAASMQPDHIHMERQIDVNATGADMMRYARDLKKVQEWSPWNELDPNLVAKYSDPTNVVGAWYSWDGNEDIGAGKMTLTSEEPGKVVHKLEFSRPFEGVADAAITWTEKGDGLTVVWAYDQEADFTTKAMTLFMSFDDMLGPNYEKGLGYLKPVVEKAAAENRAKAEAEKAEAEKAEAAMALAEADPDEMAKPAEDVIP